jgi:hypothetical protein
VFKNYNNKYELMANVNLIGLILSIVVFLALCISAPWAWNHYEEENVTINVTIPNRVAAPAELTAESVDKWGAVPG